MGSLTRSQVRIKLPMGNARSCPGDVLCQAAWHRHHTSHSQITTMEAREDMDEPLNQVSFDTVYSEMYTEMRRFRDYELRSSTWYTAILIAILGFIANSKYTAQTTPSGLALLLQGGIVARALVLLVVTALGFASSFSVWYVSRRYHSLRQLVDAQLEPAWDHSNKRAPVLPERRLTPRHMIYMVQGLLVACSYVLVLWL
jgi:hypothetical protein